MKTAIPSRSLGAACALLLGSASSSPAFAGADDRQHVNQTQVQPIIS